MVEGNTLYEILTSLYMYTSHEKGIHVDASGIFNIYIEYLYCSSRVRLSLHQANFILPWKTIPTTYYNCHEHLD